MNLGSGVAGILLTGGASSRMGADKASIRIDGTPQAERLGTLLQHVAHPVIEIGPGRSGLLHIEETPKDSGPLVAVAAGARWLHEQGYEGPALVLACDLPLLPLAMLELLASYAGSASVLPLVEGHDQPLCARWSLRDLRAAQAAIAMGERSLQRIPDRSTAVLLDTHEWNSASDAISISDIDTPEDLAALALGHRVELPNGA